MSQFMVPNIRAYGVAANNSAGSVLTAEIAIAFQQVDAAFSSFKKYSVYPDMKRILESATDHLDKALATQDSESAASALYNLNLIKGWVDEYPNADPQDQGTLETLDDKNTYTYWINKGLERVTQQLRTAKQCPL
ncbi:MAG: hypothetical protein A2289_15125 [Deltaproteobacteria bacterium RIFOXYA12_FULL_58_15]|nr:MAG: hypothetical protein A2289_15125 [Deltaproteobacteria bacterium RIFOXYA12_FULL_58_15]OGR13784.1 MAG: hypothetical protein A2341_01080 [Deltaproteobacteria bacterium RIFOXYB12_FULL_58_9]